jgi:hypothetical protein
MTTIASSGRKLIVTEFLTLDGVMEAPEKWSFKEEAHSLELTLAGHSNDCPRPPSSEFRISAVGRI